jgi:acyl-CoA reductase-like NAD-dependent aldehyde dehydrogenase
MSPETSEPIYVNSPAVKLEGLNAMMKRVKSTQRIYANHTQEKVDEIFRAAASNHIPLAKAAVEETRMGIVEDKVIKNHFASEYIYNKFHAERAGTQRSPRMHAKRELHHPNCGFIMSTSVVFQTIVHHP